MNSEIVNKKAMQPCIAFLFSEFPDCYRFQPYWFADIACFYTVLQYGMFFGPDSLLLSCFIHIAYVFILELFIGCCFFDYRFKQVIEL